MKFDVTTTFARGSIRPPAGRSPSWTAKTYWSVRPSTNTGMLMPSREMTVTMPSCHDCGWRAANLPSGIPMPAAKIIAPTVSSIVAGNRTISSWSSGWLLMTLDPKSPWNRLPR